MVCVRQVVSYVVITTQNATHYNTTLSIAKIRGIGTRRKNLQIFTFSSIYEPVAQTGP
jgi:hypothetical protein